MSAVATRIITTLTDFRCPRCGSLLCRIKLTTGSSVEIKCPKCKVVIVKDAS